MNIHTHTKLEATRHRHKFTVGDMVSVERVYDDDSSKLRERVGTIGQIAGYRDYYKGKRNYGGNRYYVRFADHYVAGFEPWLLKKVVD